MHERTSHRESLSPATGKLPGTLVDIRLKVRGGKRLVSLSTSIIGSGLFRSGWTSVSFAFIRACWSFHIRKINISGHSGAQVLVIAGQTNLNAEHLFDPVGDGLHVARREFGLAANLFDRSLKILTAERVNANAHRIAHLY